MTGWRIVTVVHVLPVDIPRGAQIYARQLADALDQPGGRHRVLVIFESGPGPLRPDIRLGVGGGRLRAIGGDPVAARRLRIALAREAPLAVVAHGGESLKYAAVATPAGVPLVYYKIGLSVGMVNPARRWLYRALMGRTQLIAAVSEEIAREARAHLRSVDRPVVVVANGRDPAPYPERRHRRTDRPRLAFVGRLIASKRPGRFLAVVAELRRRSLDFEAVLIGDGPLLEGLRGTAADLGVELLGRRTDVPELLGGSDVFVFTSEPASEGMPGVLIEAGLAGLATVSTDVPGARTVIEDGITGFVVAADDLAALGEATAELVADPELRARMGRAARARCLQQFSLAVSAEQWRELLDSLSRPPRRRW
ncbi:glycosyltransferase family 4 protein [soil metagenome]